MSASPSSPINSTTVRANPQAPWYLRAGMRGLGAVAPGLASAWGERIFLTAPRHRPPEREVATLASAREGEVLSEGQRLLTWTWGSGPNILLVHGWGGRGGQLHAFVAPSLFGPRGRPGAVDWKGPETPIEAPRIASPVWECCGDDAYVHGVIAFAEES